MREKGSARGSLANFSDVLRRSIDAGTISVGIDCSRGNSAGSPVYRPYGQAFFFYGTFSPTILFLFEWQWINAGLSLLVWMLFVTLILGRIVHARVRRDVMRLIYKDDLGIEFLWSHGILRLTHLPTGETATSPDDDWQKFLAHKVLLKVQP